MNEPVDVWFPTGVTARRLHVPANVPGDELVRVLGLPSPRGTIVVNGTTSALGRDVRDHLTQLIVDGVAALAAAEGLTVVTGATDAGIFALLGPALEGHQAPLVGVAPERLVSWPGMRARGGFAELEPLEPHHSHFVLVEGQEWGDETDALLGLCAALSRTAPSVALLCGGGAVAHAEALGHVRAGRPLVVVAGSGRFADDIVAAVQGADNTGRDRRRGDPLVEEIAASRIVRVFPLEGDPAALAELLRSALAEPPYSEP